MFSCKRMLYLGSLSILLLSGLLFVAHSKLTPIAHATSCVATGDDWSAFCTVKEGAQTNLVYAIQEAIDKSDTNCGTAEDGIFGTNTETAVLCYQKAKGLSQTGEVDSATWEQFRDGLTQLLNGCAALPTPPVSCWKNYRGYYDPTFAIFRQWVDSSGADTKWYVLVIKSQTTYWCQMNGDPPC